MIRRHTERSVAVVRCRMGSGGVGLGLAVLGWLS